MNEMVALRFVINSGISVVPSITALIKKAIYTSFDILGVR